MRRCEREGMVREGRRKRERKGRIRKTVVGDDGRKKDRENTENRKR
jgi:hypothetical protein